MMQICGYTGLIFSFSYGRNAIAELTTLDGKILTVVSSALRDLVSVLSGTWKNLKNEITTLTAIRSLVTTVIKTVFWIFAASACFILAGKALPFISVFSTPLAQGIATNLAPWAGKISVMTAAYLPECAAPVIDKVSTLVKVLLE